MPLPLMGILPYDGICTLSQANRRINYVMDLPLAWNATLKNAVKRAYKTGSLVDIREALKQIDMLQPAERGRLINVGILRTFTLETLRDHLCLSLSSIPCQPTLLFGELSNSFKKNLEQNSEQHPYAFMILLAKNRK